MRTTSSPRDRPFFRRLFAMPLLLARLRELPS
jgi:hypothetical protein